MAAFGGIIHLGYSKLNFSVFGIAWWASTHRYRLGMCGGLNFQTGPPWDLWWPMTTKHFWVLNPDPNMPLFQGQCGNVPVFWQVQVKIHGLFHLLSRVAWLHHSKNSYGKPKFEATDYAFIWREFFCFKDIHGLFTISIGLSLSFFWGMKLVTCSTFSWCAEVPVSNGPEMADLILEHGWTWHGSV